MLRVKGQVLYLYCCDLAPTVESFAVWRPRIEVSDLQHDGNHEDKCKAIRICATESGKGDQEACYGNEKGGKREEGEGEGEKGRVCQVAGRLCSAGYPATVGRIPPDRSI